MLYRNIPKAVLATAAPAAASSWLKSSGAGNENGNAAANPQDADDSAQVQDQVQQPNWQQQQGEGALPSADSKKAMGAGRGGAGGMQNIQDMLNQLQGGKGKGGFGGGKHGMNNDWANALRGVQGKEQKLQAIMNDPENRGLFPQGEQYTAQNKHTAERILADQERRKADERKEKFRQSKNPMHATIKAQKSRVEWDAESDRRKFKSIAI